MEVPLVPTTNPEGAVTLRRTNLWEARVLAELLSIQYDLRATKSFMAESLGKPASTAKSAMFSAAHMSYRRCFNRGKLGLRKQDIEALGKDISDVHGYHYSQADKLIAHSVNDYDIVEVGAHIDALENVTVGWFAARFVGLPDEDITKWLVVIEQIEAQVLVPKLEVAKAAMHEALQKIPIEELKRAPVLKHVARGKEGAGKPRDKK